MIIKFAEFSSKIRFSFAKVFQLQGSKLGSNKKNCSAHASQPALQLLVSMVTKRRHLAAASASIKLGFVKSLNKWAENCA